MFHKFIKSRVDVFRFSCSLKYFNETKNGSIKLLNQLFDRYKFNTLMMLKIC